MKLFVYENDGCRNSTAHQVLTGQWRSITRIKNLFLRSPTSVALQSRPPATTINSVTDSAPLQGPAIGDDDVPTAPQEGAPGTNDNDVTDASEEEVEKSIDVDDIEPVTATHNLRTRRQRADVSSNEEDRDNEEDENPCPTKRF